MPRPRADGSTSSSRSLATVFDLRTRNTEPTISPFRSAIQQRSPRRIEVIEEVGADARDQRLELVVVAPLARVDRAVAMNDPAHVARLVARAAGRAPRRGSGASRASGR